MRVLISGAGIAGPTLAYWLAHYGLQPTLVESAPTADRRLHHRFLGSGVRDRRSHGVLPEFAAEAYIIQEVQGRETVRGNRVAGFPADAFARMTEGRYVSLPRGELAAASLEDRRQG